MNERIEKLLYEAGAIYNGHNGLTGETYFKTETVNYEKFAELIVKECADIAAGERSGWEARKAIEETFRS